MKRMNCSFVLILLVSLGFVQSDTWYLLEVPEFGFSIQFPVKPVKSMDPDSPTPAYMYIYDATKSGTDDNLIYSATYAEIDTSAGNFEQTDALFNKAITGAVKGVKGKLLSKNTIYLNGGIPGREIRIDFKHGLAIIKMRIYVVKNKMYLLQTITETKKQYNLSVTRFMNAFLCLDRFMNSFQLQN